MNWLDIVLAVLFAAGVAGGYLQGTIRQALSLASIVCGLILATYLHVPVAALLAYPYPDVAATSRELIAFLLSAVVLVVGLEALQRQLVPDTHLLSIDLLDRLGGLVVAIFTVPLQMALALLIARLLLPVSWPVGESLRIAVVEAANSSALVPALTSVLVALVALVGALLPYGSPPFLTFK